MDLVRWAMAAFILLNAFFGTVRAIRVAAWKFERAGGRREALLTGMSWPLIALWIASMTLFLTSAVLILRQSPAASAVFFAALAFDLTVFWMAQKSARGASYAARERLTSYLLFGLLFLGSLRAERGNEPAAHRSDPASVTSDNGAPS